MSQGLNCEELFWLRPIASLLNFYGSPFARETTGGVSGTGKASDMKKQYLR
jgi:hypothetical protein